jgi:hypothetical protein
LTRIRQRWGAERFRRIFERTVLDCVKAGIAKGEVVHVDASLIQADVSWESLAERYVEAAASENDEAETALDSRKKPLRSMATRRRWRIGISSSTIMM